MKVAIDVRMVHSSGIGVYLQNLVPRLLRTRPTDQFFLLGRHEDQKSHLWDGFSNVVWTEVGSPIYSLSQRLEFKAKIPSETDLFWSPHFDCAAFWPKKILVTVHDLYHLAMPEFVGGLHKRLYARWMFDRVAAEATGIVVISEFTKGELVRFTNVDPRKVHLDPNGLDPYWSEPSTLSNPHLKPYFLYVGNIKPHKNLGRLVEAFRRLASTIPHDLVLVGQKEGFLTGDPKVQAQAARLGDRVKFTGPIQKDLLKAYYRHAEALVFPSLYEGFGMPPLEAMACDCPVIASNAASIPEVCGDAALYFEPRDVVSMASTIERLKNDSVLRNEMIERGRKRISRFSWDKSAETLASLMVKTAGG